MARPAGPCEAARGRPPARGAGVGAAPGTAGTAAPSAPPAGAPLTRADFHGGAPPQRGAALCRAAVLRAALRRATCAPGARCPLRLRACQSRGRPCPRGALPFTTKASGGRAQCGTAGPAPPRLRQAPPRPRPARPPHPVTHFPRGAGRRRSRAAGACGWRRGAAGRRGDAGTDGGGGDARPEGTAARTEPPPRGRGRISAVFPAAPSRSPGGARPARSRPFLPVWGGPPGAGAYPGHRELVIGRTGRGGLVHPPWCSSEPQTSQS